MKVIVAEDQGMLRGALSALLDLEDDIEVIGQAENGEQAMRMIEELIPDIVVMDIEMPKMSGLDVAEKLKALRHSCRVVILTTFARAGYFQRAMRAGVRGFLLKDSPIDELGAALRNVYAGGRAVSPELAIRSGSGESTQRAGTRGVKLAAEGHSRGGYCQAVISIFGHSTQLFVRGDSRSWQAQKFRIDAIGIAKKNGWLE